MDSILECENVLLRPSSNNGSSCVNKEVIKHSAHGDVSDDVNYITRDNLRYDFITR